MEIGDFDDRHVCKHCDFILHCGCCYDDHEYKMVTCSYYTLWVNHQRLLDRFAKYIEKYEGENNYDIGN